MNEKDFVDEISKRTGISDDMIKIIFDTSRNIVFEKLLYEEEIKIPKLGKFLVLEKKGQLGINLANNPDNLLGEYKYPSFKVSHAIRTNFKKHYRNNA